MKSTAKTNFQKATYNEALFKNYEIIRELIKYSFYVTPFYFASEGFMALK